MSGYTALELELLDRFQHDFPLSPRPYAVMAEQLGVSEEAVIQGLQRLQERGAVSRVGVVFQPRRVGVSTLAAMAVPRERLEAVAALVSALPQVNHNYEREHVWNLWFVVTAGTREELDGVLAHIGEETGLVVLPLPLVEDYRLDLGFPLTGIRHQDARH